MLGVLVNANNIQDKKFHIFSFLPNRRHSDFCCVFCYKQKNQHRTITILISKKTIFKSIKELLILPNFAYCICEKNRKNKKTQNYCVTFWDFRHIYYRNISQFIFLRPESAVWSEGLNQKWQIRGVNDFSFLFVILSYRQQKWIKQLLFAVRPNHR